MKKALFFIIIQLLFYQNVFAELTIRINRAEIGTLPIMISIENDSKRFLSKEIKNIIEIN